MLNKKNIIRVAFFLVLAGLASFSSAQSIIINGIVKESVNNEPLPYVNLFLQQTYFGTVSNSLGEFKLVIPPTAINDSLVISFIGYKSQKIAVTSIKSSLSIMLSENQTVLDEVLFTGYTARTILEKAINNIGVNYSLTPFITSGFYRVTSQKDKNYIHLSEAVFEIYHSSKGAQNNQFKLDRMRAIKDEKASRGIDLGLKPKGIYEFDIVRNGAVFNLLNKKGLNQHNFEVDGVELIDGREAYKIVFDQKDVKKSGYKGYMLIDKTSFAFVFFDIELSPKGLIYKKYGDASTRALMKIVGIDIAISKDNYQIKYKQVGTKYVLSNVGNDATLTFKSDREHYNFTTDTRVDYLVTEIIAENALPFTSNEILGQGKLIEEQNSIYDDDFWKNYTIVLPTSDFNSIAQTLESNNKANSTKLEIEEKLYKLPKDKAVRIDSILAFYNERGVWNGNALIAFEGDVIVQKSYNNAITKNEQLSQFRIGSLSKTFSSMIIAQLENKGKLNYSDSISKFLPNYSHGDVIISQLLSHQSGIPNFLSNPEYLTKIMTRPYSIAEIATQFCSDSLEFKPGSKFSYSNSNYVVLSLIAETIEQKGFKTLLKQYIFDPVKMENTYFGIPANTGQLVTGFMYGKPEPLYPSQNVGGAGGITSSTTDLLKWSNALDSELLLPKEKLGQIFIPRASYYDWDAYYGFGWMIDRYMFSASKHHKIVYHPGTDFGFYSMFVKVPDLGITIILLNNTGDFPRFEITELILNELN